MVRRLFLLSPLVRGLFLCVTVKMQTPTCTTELENEPDSSTPAPVQIVSVVPETKEFVLQTDELSNILLSDKCRDRPVCVVSIAGDFRKGKSFLLNFLLKYLYYQQNNQHTEDLNDEWELFENGHESEFNSDDEAGDQDHEVSSTHPIRAQWLTDTDCPLQGFSWRGGSKRDTTGILMWSEPFVVKCSDGKEVAVLLMDTQGTFDSEHTVKDSATVFALSTMTSSIQVFNVMRNLQEDNLQVLQAFTEYGRIALEVTEDAPFQNLIFLVRDWPFPYEKSFGFRGGFTLLEEKLEVKPTQHESLRQVRLFIRSCFESINCFLMPFPGEKVSTSKRFDGRLKDIDKKFLDNVQVFAPYLLSPKRLQTKKIGGVEITGRQLLEYFKVYIEIFKGETMPEPKHMYDATAEANNRAAYVSAVEHYRKKMDELCGGNAPFMNPRALALRHEELAQEAEEVFSKTRKYGGQHYSQQFLDQLKESIAESYERFVAQNNSKNVFSLLGAPLILIAWMLLLYIIANVLDLIGLDSIAHICTFFASCTFIVLVTYAIFRYALISHYCYYRR